MSSTINHTLPSLGVPQKENHSDSKDKDAGWWIIASTIASMVLFFFATIADAFSILCPLGVFFFSTICIIGGLGLLAYAVFRSLKVIASEGGATIFWSSGKTYKPYDKNNYNYNYNYNYNSNSNRNNSNYNGGYPGRHSGSTGTTYDPYSTWNLLSTSHNQSGGTYHTGYGSNNPVYRPPGNSNNNLNNYSYSKKSGYGNNF